MTAVLRKYAFVINGVLPGDMFCEIRKQRFPDSWWDKDGWDGLDDIVDEFEIDTDTVKDPWDFRWSGRESFINVFMNEKTKEFFACEYEKILPDAAPGDMFCCEGSVVKSAREVTWTERLDMLASSCSTCRNQSYDDYECIITCEENGEVTRVWTLGQLSPCALSVPDDYRRITAWNGAQPLHPIGCPTFEWD